MCWPFGAWCDFGTYENKVENPLETSQSCKMKTFRYLQKYAAWYCKRIFSPIFHNRKLGNILIYYINWKLIWRIKVSSSLYTFLLNSLHFLLLSSKYLRINLIVHKISWPISVLLRCPCHFSTPTMAVVNDWNHFSNTRCPTLVPMVVCSPFQWHFIWQKSLFQASLSHHKFGCHPCFLGFKFPKCSLLKSNIHSKVYYSKFNLTETRSQNGHFPITQVLMIRTRPYNSTWLDYSLFLWKW